MDKNISTMKLPGLLAEVEEVIGRDAAIKFAKACGGTRIYMPMHLHPDHWIITTIGVDAARKLVAHFSVGRGGLRLDVPLMPRRLQVAELSETGDSARQIALKLRITTRSVHRNRNTTDLKS